uniref:Neuropeptides B and W receptor 1 n=1 Tax=Cyanoderma ruficeps TaxID=181631 RepID=A0A8C3RFI7_9PASS
QGSAGHRDSDPAGPADAACSWDLSPHCCTARPPTYYITVSVIYSVICALGLTGNTAAIHVILKAPKMKTVTNIFILTLAIADELFTLVLPISIADYLLLQWSNNTFSSIYFLTVMSVDCYLVVVATTESREVSHRTYRAAKAVTVHEEQGRPQCIFVFPQPESMWWKGSQIHTLILGFVIPVSTICTLYTTMLCRLRQVQLHCTAKALDKAKIKVTLVVVAVLCVCLFCWMPFHISAVVALIMDIPQTPLIIGISDFITSLSYANSCLNPFLYTFLDDSFPRSFHRLIDHRTTS